MSKHVGHLCPMCGLEWARTVCFNEPKTCNNSADPCPKCSPDSNYTRYYVTEWKYIDQFLAWAKEIRAQNE